MSTDGSTVSASPIGGRSGMRFRSGAATHPGARRTLNEDAFVARPEAGIWAVADGVGGHEAGDFAAATVASALGAVPATLDAAALLTEVRAALDDVHAALRADAARREMDSVIASTVVVLLARDDHFACLWAGDSRAYLLRDGVLRQITHDHSLVQELVATGALSAAAAEHHPRANVITRAAGAKTEALVLDKVSDRLLAGDRFLLCSDGLCRALAPTEIAAPLGDAEPQRAAERLVTAALDHEASDNVTVVVVVVGA